MSWNLGDVWDTVAASVAPADPAIFFQERTTSWGDFASRASAIAHALLTAGLKSGDKLAFLLRNHPAYVEGVYAAFKVALTHVNVNFRYTGRELHYILENSDASALIYGQEFAAQVAELKPQLPHIRSYLEVGPQPCRNSFATSFDICATSGRAAPVVARSPDDLVFIYTGGTTGLPKGVMWTHGALWTALGGGASMQGLEAPRSLAELGARVQSGVGRSRILIAPPLMHGTGLMMTISILARGGSVILADNRGLDAHAIWADVTRHQPDMMVIVGDAFARPLLRALEDTPGRYDLSSLKMIISSGTMCSPETKAGLLQHHPAMIFIDTLGASEGIGTATAISTAAGVSERARFDRDPRMTKVLTDDGREVQPGSGEAGRIARAGPLPLGYYKDPDKTAQTYMTIDGVRYGFAGDWATVEADGSLRLLGRGSQCINTGGEKVYPEEVEEALKSHPMIEDALVFGMPDPQWGQAVTAVVHHRGSKVPTLTELRAHVKERLAGYKAPKAIVSVAKVPRGPNGKADYALAKELAQSIKGQPK